MKVEHTQKTSYQFKLRMPIGDAGYSKWKKKVQDRHNQVKPV